MVVDKMSVSPDATHAPNSMGATWGCKWEKYYVSAYQLGLSWTRQIAHWFQFRLSNRGFSHHSAQQADLASVQHFMITRKQKAAITIGKGGVRRL